MPSKRGRIRFLPIGFKRPFIRLLYASIILTLRRLLAIRDEKLNRDGLLTFMVGT